jgi:hypothetical protein
MLEELENRKHRRYPTIARVRIREAFEGDALLKDLSVTGCRIECTMHTEVQLNTLYMLYISPEKAAKIGEFELMAESKWLVAGDYSCEIGFSIVESPAPKKPFLRYVDYHAWRSTT